MRSEPDNDIVMAPLFTTLEHIDIQTLVDGADHPWYTRTLLHVGEALVRLGVLQPGSSHWHHHDEEDEFFYVIDGRLRIQLHEQEPVELGPGQAFSVPAGLPHRPSALLPTTVLMIEKAGVTTTGDG